MKHWINWLALLVFISISTLNLSCKKSEAYNPGKVLSSGSWHYTNLEKRFVSGGIPGNWESKFDTLEPCFKDDITFFNSDYSYELNESAISCPGNTSAVIESGSWSIHSDTLQVDVQNGGAIIKTRVFKMVNLSNQILQLIDQGSTANFPVSQGAPPDYEEYKWTYSH